MERDGWTIGRTARYAFGIALVALGGIGVTGVLVGVYALFFDSDSSSYKGELLKILAVFAVLLVLSLFMIKWGLRIISGAKPPKQYYDAVVHEPQIDVELPDTVTSPTSLDPGPTDDAIVTKLGKKKETPGVPGLPKIKKKDDSDISDDVA